jgi:hypothetical protein
MFWGRRMLNGGHRLKVVRLDRSLTYRDVEHLSRVLSGRYADDRYTVRISVLADIENHGTAPSIFRLHTLCKIYALDMARVLAWFGVPIQCIRANSRSRIRQAADKNERSANNQAIV